MMFLLGFLSGVIIVIAIIVIESYLVARRKGVIESVVEKVGRVTKPKAEIFFPKTDEQIAQEDLIDKNASKGEGTPLKDLGL